MAHIDHTPSKYQLNLLHILPPYANKESGIVNALIEINSHTINKYEIITESGQLKLDRVGYSSLSYPFAYGAIPCTWDEDGDPLDIEIVGVTEPLIPGSLVEARVIGWRNLTTARRPFGRGAATSASVSDSSSDIQTGMGFSLESNHRRWVNEPAKKCGVASSYFLSG